MSPAKHSSASVTDGQTDGQIDGRTDDGQSDPYVSLCFAGDTKSSMTQYNIHDIHLSLTKASALMTNNKK